MPECGYVVDIADSYTDTPSENVWAGSLLFALLDRCYKMHPQIGKTRYLVHISKACHKGGSVSLFKKRLAPQSYLYNRFYGLTPPIFTVWKKKKGAS